VGAGGLVTHLVVLCGFKHCDFYRNPCVSLGGGSSGDGLLGADTLGVGQIFQHAGLVIRHLELDRIPRRPIESEVVKRSSGHVRPTPAPVNHRLLVGLVERQRFDCGQFWIGQPVVDGQDRGAPRVLGEIGQRLAEAYLIQNLGG